MYPAVIGEFDTIREINKGRSIARFGDGELKTMDGNGVYTRELKANSALVNELRAVARAPHGNCLIGIPTMDPKGTKYENWQRHKQRFCKYFGAHTGFTYYSALISRPDCGDWLETREYYELMVSMWAGKRRVAIVSEVESKLLSCVRLTNPVVHIACPMYGAYAFIDAMEKKVLEAKPDIALLSVGVTATCLANRLSTHGIQAIDLGSIGGFLLRWRSGQPKPKSYAVERAT